MPHDSCDAALVREAIEEAIATDSTELNLSYRSNISDVLPEIIKVKNLRTLNLSYCCLKDPECLLQLKNLEELNLEENSCTAEFIGRLGVLKNLRVLNISYAGFFEHFPEGLTKLENLEELHCDGCDFKSFPDSFKNLKRLQSLRLKWYEGELEELFRLLSSLQNLRKLRISKGWMYEEETDEHRPCTLPENIKDLTALVELDLSHWESLASIPSSISELKNLRRLDLSLDMNDDDATLTELPEAITELSNLEVLDVSRQSKLTALPRGFEKLTKLKDLDTVGSGITDLSSLSGNQLKNLESLSAQGKLPALTQCKKLQTLWYFGEQVGIYFQTPSGVVYGTGEHRDFETVDLPSLTFFGVMGGKLGSTDFLMRFPKLESLRLACDFECLPENIADLKHLKEIDIYGARSLQKFPESFGRLENLESLAIDAARIPHLGKSLEKLTKLKSLSISYSLFVGSEFESSWYTAPNVETLTIEGCGVSEMADGISQWKKLEFLEIQNSSVCKLPADFPQLENLKSFNCFRCPITRLPEASSYPQNLKYSRLELQGTCMHIPEAFYKMPKLRSLEFENQSMERLPDGFANFPALTDLKLFFCKKLTALPDKLTLASSVKNLTLYDCCDGHFPKQLRSLEGLEKLTFQSCSNMDQKAIENIQKKYPNKVVVSKY